MIAPEAETVARELVLAGGQVADTPPPHVPRQRLQRRCQRVEHEPMGPLGRTQTRTLPAVKHQGIHQASGPGQHGSPAADATHDGNVQPPAGAQVDLFFDSRRPAQHDHRPIRFPEAKRFDRLVGGFGFLQEGLVQRQVLGRTGECKVQVSHPALSLRPAG